MLEKPQVGNLVKELRQSLGLTQEKFAAKLGVTFPTINRWENNRAKPSPLAMDKIKTIVQSLNESPSTTHQQLGDNLLRKYFSELRLK
ncbi:MAG: helix-turn-helix domain-containing protein [Heteroscytonema crispum UTEX LB 1556]